MRILISVMALAALGACMDERRVETVAPVAPPISLPPVPPVDQTPLPPSGGSPIPVDPVILSAPPVSPDPERSGCLVTYPDGTEAVQRRTAEGNMQQTPADFLDPALVSSLEPC